MSDQTSLSNLPYYRNMTLRAAQEDEIFAKFRIQPELANIYDIVGSEEMQRAFTWNHIKAAEMLCPQLMGMIGIAKLNDSCGGAAVFPTPVGPELSAATARYVKYLADILYLFKNLEGSNIVEIGSAYGGLSALMHNTYQNHRSYTVFDLPEVNLLAARYHRTIGVADVRYQTMDDLAKVEAVPSDLFISTHALSEITRDQQKIYIEKIVKHARHGFVLYNHFFEGHARKTGLDIMSVEEFAAQIPGCELQTEPPLVLQSDLVHKSTLVIW